jgi:hypothetical protein
MHCTALHREYPSELQLSFGYVVVVHVCVTNIHACATGCMERRTRWRCPSEPICFFQPITSYGAATQLFHFMRCKIATRAPTAAVRMDFGQKEGPGMTWVQPKEGRYVLLEASLCRMASNKTSIPTQRACKTAASIAVPSRVLPTRKWRLTSVKG